MNAFYILWAYGVIIAVSCNFDLEKYRVTFTFRVIFVFHQKLSVQLLHLVITDEPHPSQNVSLENWIFTPRLFISMTIGINVE